jgi:hypothetical protein
MIYELKSKGYQNLRQISQGNWNIGKQCWLSWREIDLKEYVDTWENYTQIL